jgi:hypothetical protein
MLFLDFENGLYFYVMTVTNNHANESTVNNKKYCVLCIVNPITFSTNFIGSYHTRFDLTWSSSSCKVEIPVVETNKVRGKGFWIGNIQNFI